MEEGKKHNMLVLFGAIIILALVAYGVFAFFSKREPTRGELLEQALESITAPKIPGGAAGQPEISDELRKSIGAPQVPAPASRGQEQVEPLPDELKESISGPKIPR